MKATKIFMMAALALTFAACSNDDNDLAQQPAEQPANDEITITATVSSDDGATTRALSIDGSNIASTWEADDQFAILYNDGTNNVKRVATVSSINGSTVTITFTIPSSLANNTACKIVYPASAANAANTGADVATALAAQDGTIGNCPEVRVGTATIDKDNHNLAGVTKLVAQNAIFKFITQSVPSAGGSLQNTNVTSLTVTTGGQDYVITPASATSTLYAALPAVSGQTVSFTATDGSNLYAASKASVSFDAAKYYQSTVKMGKVIEVFHDDDPYLEDFTRNPSYKYLHIGLEQAYAIARQLSTQNTGATVAVVYNNDNKNVTYALSSDASATARTHRFNDLFANNYRVFLATLWENAD